jgi:hypothetical protein
VNGGEVAPFRWSPPGKAIESQTKGAQLAGRTPSKKCRKNGDRSGGLGVLCLAFARRAAARALGEVLLDLPDRLG